MPEQKKPAGDTTRLILPEQLAQIRAMHTENRRVSVIVLSGWQIGREYVLEVPEVIIGRSPDVAVSINLPSVSRHHARINFGTAEDGSFFEVSDLGSTNGTQVNNQPVTSSRLQNGDKIQIGDVVLKFVVQDALDAQFHQEVHRRIHYDQLTGLLTLDSFKPHVVSAIADSKGDTRFTVAMTDLDGLKRVNDTFGHPIGRSVVQEMGVKIRAVLRPSDRAGLFGGDEAVFLYPNTPIAEAAEIAEKLRLSIQDHDFSANGTPFRVSISQGLAEYPTHGTTMEQIIAAADGALYAAKGAGRNCVRFAEC